MVEPQVHLKRIKDYQYLETELIGSGNFGKVFMGSHIETGAKVAIKVLPIAEIVKNDLRKVQLLREIESMRKYSKLSNPNLVRLDEVLQTPNNVYIIMEQCDGGNLETYLKASPDRRIAERQMRSIFSDIAKGFTELQKLNILHRDVKAENILSANGVWKVGDFGFSRELNADEKAQTLVGSPYYMAPQILGLEGNYTSKCDIWSLGVLLYRCLYGRYPFTGKSLEELRKNVLENPLSFPTSPSISTELKELMKRMMTVDETKRLDWEEFLNFKWVE